MVLFFSLWLLFIGPDNLAWAEPSQTATKSEVKGDVLYWEGDELVVKELSGHEVRLRVTADTKIQGASGRLKTGDKIAAQVAPEGPALSITLQVPDSGGPPVR
jgi:hypothetical protein